MLNTRKTIIILIILCVVFTFIGCDRYAYKRPSAENSPNTIWISEDPNIWFEVGIEDEYPNMLGKLTTGDKEYNIRIKYDPGTRIFFIDNDYRDDEFSDDAVILNGNCKFRKSKLIVSIGDGKFDVNKVLPSSIKKITFVRKDITDKDVKKLVDINAVAIIYDGSKYEGYQIIDEKAHIYYKVTFRNNSDRDRKFRLEVDFKEWEEDKFVGERYLTGRLRGTDQDILEIKAGETVTYHLDFTGEFAGKVKEPEGKNMSMYNWIHEL